jgi:hypothetical protein
MNHPWQQPIRPLEVLIPDTQHPERRFWVPVLFIRPRGTRGWEVISMAGNVWNDLQCELMEVKA